MLVSLKMFWPFMVSCTIYVPPNDGNSVWATYFGVFYLSSLAELVWERYRSAHSSLDGGSDMKLLDYSVKKRTDAATNEINSWVHVYMVFIFSRSANTTLDLRQLCLIIQTGYYIIEAANYLFSYIIIRSEGRPIWGWVPIHTFINCSLLKVSVHH